MQSAPSGDRWPSIERLWYSSDGGWPAAALAPISAIYRGASAVNAFAARHRARRAPVPVISVGNLTVGGNGKTPFTLFLASLLRDHGLRVAIVSRGYGRGQTLPGIVSDGGRVLMGPREAGDEPVMMAKSFAGPIAVARRRIDAILLLMRAGPLNVAILDDGFQHLRLRRDLDLLLVAESRGFGNGRVLPAGPMREPLCAIDRADAVVLVGTDGDASGLTASHRAALARRPLLRAAIGPASLVRSRDGQWIESPLELRGRRVFLVSGLANPQGFHSMVRRLGAEIGGAIAYRDHHDYGPGDWENIAAAARRADLVLTTEKDLTKLERFSSAGFSLHALRLKVTMEADDRERLLEMALGAVRRYRENGSGRIQQIMSNERQ